MAIAGHAMNSSLRIVLIASVLSTAAGSLRGKSGRKIQPEQTLHIHLYDQAHVPTGTLNSATAEAARIFTAVGIKILWERPSAELPRDQGLDMSSATPRKLGERQYLAVRIMGLTPAAAFPGALGFALPFAQTGAHVSIFCDRVEAFARSFSLTSYVVLGHAIAHEIGHVLLRSSEHSASGLMQPRWNQASWRLASAGLISFVPEQAAAIREAVRTFTTPHPDRGSTSWDELDYTHNSTPQISERR